MLHIQAIVILPRKRNTQNRNTRQEVRYYGVDPGTTEPIPVLQTRFLYYGIDSNTTEPIAVLRDRFGYCRIDYGIQEESMREK